MWGQLSERELSVVLLAALLVILLVEKLLKGVQRALVLILHVKLKLLGKEIVHIDIHRTQRGKERTPRIEE
jgi:hypothetical protein